MIDIAIIGAGFSGLATAWSFLQRHSPLSPINVTIYSDQKIGISTSGIAAGLLHPFVGLHAKLNQNGFEGYYATEKLIAIAEQFLGKPVADRSGLCRLSLSESQELNYKKASERYPNHIKWLEAEKVSNYIPGGCPYPGIYIKDAMAVYAPEYLQGLWLACQSKGASFKEVKVNSLQELSDHDLIIVAMGADCTSLPELKHLSLTRTKGQLLELQWPEELPVLPISVNSQLYCLMTADKRHCVVGSTYEKVFSDVEPNKDIAVKELIPKLSALIPALDDAAITDCRAGVRATTPNREPLIKKISEKCWVISGMGSKGLLYHALYADILVESVLHDLMMHNSS